MRKHIPMGVKCSLLGHDYGESEIERERDEEGDEVVRTAKRVERCRQCGRTRTISENTEVTTLEAAAGVVREPDGTVVATTDEATITDEIDGDVVIESPAGERPVGGATAVEEPASTGEPASSGESIANGEPTSVEPLGASDTESEMNYSSEIIESVTSSETDDGRVVEDESTGSVAIDRIGHDRKPQRPTRAPGEWPTDPDEDGATTGDPDDAGSLADGGAAVASWPETDGPEAVADDEAEATTRGKRQSRRPGDTLSCGSCRFTRLVADSPLRAGDICPDCGSGYLAWETRKG
ncbi:hypothetical protein C448_02698 [Halococcus morrhuae DSM 1307]|uniref:Uncharacterized protein n=2 Tax=Halococcus morrhuae TaxID=2250 RepID=M0MVB7_HALMO|nr:hypothetical protein C448_02698 [Halococcus morrhuae DSM 1307]